jgi:hypothetical protein
MTVLPDIAKNRQTVAAGRCPASVQRGKDELAAQDQWND